MTPRLNVNLNKEDQKKLEELRHLYEALNEGKKLSYAEVVRRAIDHAHKVAIAV